MYWCQYVILIMGVVRYLMLVEKTNMVEAIPIRHMFTIHLSLSRSTIPAFHSELTTYTISRLFTLGDNCELKGVHKGFTTKVKASGVIIVLLKQV